MVSASEPESLGAPFEYEEYFESRASFVRRVATEVLLSISARRNNGVPVGGDELAAVASANRLAKELGIQ